MHCRPTLPGTSKDQLIGLYSGLSSSERVCPNSFSQLHVTNFLCPGSTGRMHQYRVLSSFNIIRLRGGLGPPLRATREPCENIMRVEAHERPTDHRTETETYFNIITDFNIKLDAIRAPRPGKSVTMDLSKIPRGSHPSRYGAATGRPWHSRAATIPEVFSESSSSSARPPALVGIWGSRC